MIFDWANYSRMSSRKDLLKYRLIPEFIGRLPVELRR